MSQPDTWDKVTSIREFLRWLEVKHNVKLDWSETDMDSFRHLQGLIDEYFGLDRQQELVKLKRGVAVSARLDRHLANTGLQ